MLIHWVNLIISILLGAVGQIMLKLSTHHNNQEGFKFFLEMAKKPWIYLSVITYGASFILWLLALRYFKLGFARPFTSFGYIITYFLAVSFLGEPFYIKRLIGILIIVIGVAFLK